MSSYLCGLPLKYWPDFERQIKTHHSHGVFAIYERNRYAMTSKNLSHTPLWSFADDVEELQPASLPIVGQHLELDEPAGQCGEGEGLEGQGVRLLPRVLQTGVQHGSPGAIRTLNTASG